MQKLIFTSSNKPLTKNKIQDSDEFGHEPSETEKTSSNSSIWKSNTEWLLLIQSESEDHKDYDCFKFDHFRVVRILSP